MPSTRSPRPPRRRTPAHRLRRHSLTRRLALAKLRELRRLGMSYREIGHRYGGGRGPADAPPGPAPHPRLSPERLLQHQPGPDGKADSDRDALLAALDALDQEFLFYDCDGELVHATRALREALATHEPGLHEEIHLFATSSCGVARLRRIEEGRVLERMAVQELTGTTPRRLVASYIGLDLFGGGPTVLIALEEGAVDPLDPQLLQQRFGLTPAQCRVARLLAYGRSNEDVAEALCLSPHTARNHTQRILEALGVNSRAQVASVLLRLHAAGYENEQN